MDRTLLCKVLGTGAVVYIPEETVDKARSIVSLQPGGWDLSDDSSDCIHVHTTFCSHMRDCSLRLAYICGRRLAPINQSCRLEGDIVSKLVDLF